ncbi:MAG: tRNA preQ1(34) S-adenosylmethionine ribosyltransferase-isomerase QueA [Polyangiaceae bacterium]
MRLDLLDYVLPDELIARRPAPVRDASRLLVVEPGAGAGAAGGEVELTHRRVADLAELVPEGALIVVNDTRVIPARLLGRKVGTGGSVELLLVRPLGGGARNERAGGERAGGEGVGGERAGGEGVERERAGGERAGVEYLAMGRASKGLRAGTEVAFDDGRLVARVEGREGDDGLYVVTLRARDGDVAGAIERAGHMPLPPYMHRPDDAADRERYQTVYARVPGAIAAPTAGLHLTEELFARLASRGVERAQVTLHVGLGTFQPVTVSDLDEHPMHSEAFDVPEATREAVARARERGAPVVAVGTTVVRALESAADPERVGHVRAAAGETRLLIQPGFGFRVVDRLLTNFHLPRSTLLALVYAFAGAARVRRAYEVAVAERYRFYSYGDAMLLRRDAQGSQPQGSQPQGSQP